MTDRTGQATRETREVKARVAVNLDVSGYNVAISAQKQEEGISVDIGAHFLEQYRRFSGFGGEITAQGDLPHHVLEDAGISEGQALNEALGDRAGIVRTASHIMPMEGAIVTVAIDISGRPYAAIDFAALGKDPMAQMVKHMLVAMAMHGKFDLYVRVEWVGDPIVLSHHALETVGKALGKVLKAATRIEGTEILSTKGSL